MALIALTAVMACGLPNQEISQRLDIGLPTVKFHVNNILAKLQAENRTAAVLAALRHKLAALEHGAVQSAITARDHSAQFRPAITMRHHSATVPSMQVTTSPPIQMSAPLCSTCTRPARPSAAPCAAT